MLDRPSDEARRALADRIEGVVFAKRLKGDGLIMVQAKFDTWKTILAALRDNPAGGEAAAERRGEETMCEAAAMVCDTFAEGADAALKDSDPEQAERWEAAKHCAEELATAIRSLLTPDQSPLSAGGGDA